MTRTGSCLCGKVRYTLEGEPFLTGVRYCADCRKESGPAFTFYAKRPLAAFRVSGLVRTSHGRSFCPECGSRLFNLHDDDFEIRLGSLDDGRTGLMPMQDGWTVRREHWLTPIPNIVHADRDQPA